MTFFNRRDEKQVNQKPQKSKKPYRQCVTPTLGSYSIGKRNPIRFTCSRDVLESWALVYIKVACFARITEKKEGRQTWRNYLAMPAPSLGHLVMQCVSIRPPTSHRNSGLNVAFWTKRHSDIIRPQPLSVTPLANETQTQEMHLNTQSFLLWQDLLERQGKGRWRWGDYLTMAALELHLHLDNFWRMAWCFNRQENTQSKVQWFAYQKVIVYFSGYSLGKWDPSLLS